MLVCSKCGEPVRMSGHPCPSCGHRGAIEERLFRGERRAEPATAPAEGLPEPPTATGLLLDAERAWSPWLAGAVGVLFGPTAAVVVAAQNLRRWRPTSPDPWLVGLWVLVGQLLAAVGAGFAARKSIGLAGAALGLYALVVLALTIRWQWAPVAEQRAARPGQHVPGADAFGAFFAAVLAGLVGFWLTNLIAGRLSHGAWGQALHSFFKPSS